LIRGKRSRRLSSVGKCKEKSVIALHVIKVESGQRKDGNRVELTYELPRMLIAAADKNRLNARPEASCQ
jgi:hypothetical protein